MLANRATRLRGSLRPLYRLASTVSPSHVASSSTSEPSLIPLSNIEAQWEKLSTDEQITVHRQLEQIQKKDWKQLSLDEKKAAYYVAFGPHGPRTPINPPGNTLKVALGVLALLGASGALFSITRSFAHPPPQSMSKEWQEASNERALEQKINPIRGISSEGYKGKGFVTESK